MGGVPVGQVDPQENTGMGQVVLARLIESFRIDSHKHLAGQVEGGQETWHPPALLFPEKFPADL